VADDPLRPFRLEETPLLDEWSIDGHRFVDGDGRAWLYYNVRNEATRHPDGTIGCGNVVDQLLDCGRLAGVPREVTYPSERWEGNREGSWYWNEGPTVLRRRDRYHLLYSGGFFGDGTYAIGQAVASAPTGPWRKDPRNPTFVGGRRIRGPGHNCVVLGPDGVTPYAVYHGYVAGRQGRKVHVDRLRWNGDGLVIGAGWAVPGRPTDHPQPVPPPATVDPTVAWWHAEAWVRAAAVVVGGHRVPVPHPGVLTRVEVRADPTGTCVAVGDRLTRLSDQPLARELRAEGSVVSSSISSHLADERLHDLRPGERTGWHWGGDGPVEVVAAVRGTGRLEVDGAEVGAIASGEYVPLHLSLAGPVGTVAVLAGTGGAVVTDVAITAR